MSSSVQSTSSSQSAQHPHHFPIDDIPSQKILHILTTIPSSLEERDQQYWLAGEISNGTSVRRFWSSDLRIPDSPRMRSIGFSEDMSHVVEGRSFQVHIPSEFEGGQLIYKIVRHNLATQETTWSLGKNRQLPLHPATHLVPTLFAHPVKCVEDAIERTMVDVPFRKALGEALSAIQSDPEFLRAVETLMQNPTSLICSHDWAFPLLHQLVYAVQKDFAFKYSFEQFLTELRQQRAPMSFVTSILDDLFLSPLNPESCPQLTPPSVEALDKLRKCITQFLSRDPSISAAWASLHKDPLSAKQWLFPLLHKTIETLKQEPETLSAFERFIQTLVVTTGTSEQIH